MLDVKVGDEVWRHIGAEGGAKMPLKVTAIEGDKIFCGLWIFDRETGAEIDEEIGWGPPPLVTGSILKTAKSPGL